MKRRRVTAQTIFALTCEACGAVEVEVGEFGRYEGYSVCPTCHGNSYCQKELQERRAREDEETRSLLTK